MSKSKPQTQTSLEEVSVDFAVSLNLSQIVQEIASEVDVAGIVQFVKSLDEVCDDFDITKALYDYFHEKMRDFVERTS